jgi:hypothetical protein
MPPENTEKDKPVVVMEEVAALLAEPLDVDNFVNLQKQLARAEAWLGRVAFQYRNAARFLAIARRQLLMPKSKDYTDMDRTINVEAMTADQQCSADMLKDYADALAKRLSLGQSFMASQRQELKSNIR